MSDQIRILNTASSTGKQCFGSVSDHIRILDTASSTGTDLGGEHLLLAAGPGLVNVGLVLELLGQMLQTLQS